MEEKVVQSMTTEVDADDVEGGWNEYQTWELVPIYQMGWRDRLFGHSPPEYPAWRSVEVSDVIREVYEWIERWANIRDLDTYLRTETAVEDGVEYLTGAEGYIHEPLTEEQENDYRERWHDVFVMRFNKEWQDQLSPRRDGPGRVSFNINRYPARPYNFYPDRIKVDATFDKDALTYWDTRDFDENISLAIDAVLPDGRWEYR